MSTTITATDVRDNASDLTRRVRRRLMLVNGVFLTLIGGVQVTFELLAHYAGSGPYKTVFDSSPYTIGWVENHGLAFLIGILFLTVAARDGRRFWHLFALAVHALLGAANLAFWDSFVHFDVVPMGVAATIAHLAFVLAHTLCLTWSTRPAMSMSTPTGQRYPGQAPG
jgi:hypothetical protein